MGVGVFIGCLPFYGLHLLMVIVIGRLARLNRLKMYVGANISNPLFAPALVLAEVQTGGWVRRGTLHDLSLAYIRSVEPWTFGADLLIGSIVVGVVAALGIAVATYATVRRAPALPQHLERTFAVAADRYLDVGITAWEFARGKLRGDPVYRATLQGLLPPGHTLVDIGCGQGLMLAVLADARHMAVRGEWVGTLPPAYASLIGIETRARVARMAGRALGEAAVVVHAAAPAGLPERMSAALLFDVLHLMPPDAQESLLAEIVARLEPGGIVLVREVDRAAGRGFTAVRMGNRLKALAVGRWRQSFHFRSAAEWRALFEASGFAVETRPMGEGTPFANVLFRLQVTSSKFKVQS
jgi:SAM-dependent methyltransferase